MTRIIRNSLHSENDILFVTFASQIKRRRMFFEMLKTSINDKFLREISLSIRKFAFSSLHYNFYVEKRFLKIISTSFNSHKHYFIEKSVVINSAKLDITISKDIFVRSIMSFLISSTNEFTFINDTINVATETKHFTTSTHSYETRRAQNIKNDDVDQKLFAKKVKTKTETETKKIKRKNKKENKNK